MIGPVLVMMFQAAAGAPAAAPQPTTAPLTAEAPAATPSEIQTRLDALRQRQKLVCRSVTVVGSRVPVRKCTSKADDEAESATSRAWTERAQQQMPTNVQ